MIVTAESPLLNQIIEALDIERLRALVMLYAYTVSEARANIIEAYARQEKY